MPCSPRRLHWDIFCNVIDNFGDIGVCWRLARQLVSEHSFPVRLWVDQLDTFAHICPEMDAMKPRQSVQGVDVRHWGGDFSLINPGDVVVEAFACQLPEKYVQAMADRRSSPVWINLDYLSAEDWVSGCHGLPSPHPRLPLTKYFFFPGFGDTTGGLLREYDLEERRELFCASTENSHELLSKIGQALPPSESITVSLFSYENETLKSLLETWTRSSVPVRCMAPITRNLPAIEAFAGKQLQTGKVVQRGNLEIRILPFVSQQDYDKLLWLSDLNCVRGEDSFVRAQWAKKPMLWHIYPQSEGTHLIKLSAFLDLYCTGLNVDTANTVKEIHAAWNTQDKSGTISPALWQRWIDARPELDSHARDWGNRQSKQEDLCSSLVRFCRSKL